MENPATFLHTVQVFSVLKVITRDRERALGTPLRATFRARGRLPQHDLTLQVCSGFVQPFHSLLLQPINNLVICQVRYRNHILLHHSLMVRLDLFLHVFFINKNAIPLKRLVQRVAELFVKTAIFGPP